MKMILVMLIIISASGCATLPHERPFHSVVVDPASICKNCNLHNDLVVCNSIAQNNTNYAGNALGGAAVGAATGAIFGAILGLDIGTLAAAGAAGGGIGGLGNEAATVRQMVVNCMRARGYSVLR
jgi:uncharacterized protein YcfJ